MFYEPGSGREGALPLRLVASRLSAPPLRFVLRVKTSRLCRRRGERRRGEERRAEQSRGEEERRREERRRGGHLPPGEERETLRIGAARGARGSATSPNTGETIYSLQGKGRAPLGGRQRGASVVTHTHTHTHTPTHTDTHTHTHTHTHAPTHTHTHTRTDTHRLWPAALPWRQ